VCGDCFRVVHGKKAATSDAYVLRAHRRHCPAKQENERLSRLHTVQVVNKGCGLCCDVVEEIDIEYDATGRKEEDGASHHQDEEDSDGTRIPEESNDPAALASCDLFSSLGADAADVLEEDLLLYDSNTASTHRKRSRAESH
jgi:hypothetical protein